MDKLRIKKRKNGKYVAQLKTLFFYETIFQSGEFKTEDECAEFIHNKYGKNNYEIINYEKI